MPSIFTIVFDSDMFFNFKRKWLTEETLYMCAVYFTAKKRCVDKICPEQKSVKLFTHPNLVTVNIPVTFKFYNCPNGDGTSDGHNGFHAHSAHQTARQKDQRSRSAVTVRVNRPLLEMDVQSMGRSLFRHWIKKDRCPNV